MRPPDMTNLDHLAARHAHGTRVRYMTGCKCMLCRAANSRYETERKIARKNGDWNGLVSAGQARHHLRMLSRRGIGRRLVADLCGISDSALHEIKHGRKLKIRARTEKRILAITAEARTSRTLIDARPVWNQIERLLREGFTRGELSRRLGSLAKVPSLQVRRDVVTAETAMRVEKLYAAVMAGSGERTRQATGRSFAQGGRRWQ